MYESVYYPSERKVNCLTKYRAIKIMTQNEGILQIKSVKDLLKDYSTFSYCEKKKKELN